MIDIENLSFKFKYKLLFDNFNLHVNEGEIVSIIGPNGSGKSTLVKILAGIYKYNGVIKINDKLLIKDNINDIRKDIGFVFSNPDNQFVSETVMDEIAFSLENLNMKKNVIKSKVEGISKYLGIYDILEKNPHHLNNNDKELVILASALIHEPKILILDEALMLLDPFTKDNIINILKELNKKGLTIINISHDIEDTLISDKVCVINEGKIIINGTKEEVYEDEDKLYSLGYKLPFMVELSNRMIFYGLIDHVVYNMEEMVDLIWK